MCELRDIAIAISIALLLPVTIHLGTYLMVKVPTVKNIGVTMPPDSVREQDEALWKADMEKYQQERRRATEEAARGYRRQTLYIKAAISTLVVIAGILSPWNVIGAGLIASGPISILADRYVARWCPFDTWLGFFILLLMLLFLLSSPYWRIMRWLKILQTN